MAESSDLSRLAQSVRRALGAAVGSTGHVRLRNAGEGLTFVEQIRTAAKGYKDPQGKRNLDEVERQLRELERKAIPETVQQLLQKANANGATRDLRAKVRQSISQLLTQYRLSPADVGTNESTLRELG